MNVLFLDSSIEIIPVSETLCGLAFEALQKPTRQGMGPDGLSLVHSDEGERLDRCIDGRPALRSSRFSRFAP
jgi:hypothetical protein